MLHGTLWDKIPRFAVPVAATAILSQLFNAADIAVIGNFTGELRTVAVAAVGTNSSIISLIVNLFIGIALGANVTIAHAIGEKNDTMVHHAVHTSIVVAVLGGLIAAVIGELFAVPLLNQLNVPDDVFPLALLYLRIYLAGLPVILLYNFEAAVFRSVGETKIPLIALTASGVLNVILNLFFVAVLHMSVDGVAIATVLSNAVSAAILWVFLLKTDKVIRLEPKKLRIDGLCLKQILRIGVPAGVQSAMFSIANIVIQGAINSLGTVVMAASSAAYNIEVITYDILNSFSQACTTFVGQNFGAGEIKRCKKTLLLCLLEGIISLGVAIALILFFGKSLLTIFNGDPQVVETGYIRLMLIMPSHLFSLCYEVLSGYLRGFEISLPPAVLTMLGVCGVRLSWLRWVFPQYKTFMNIMLVFPISLATTALLMLAAVLYFRPSRRYAHLQKSDGAASAKKSKDKTIPKIDKAARLPFRQAPCFTFFDGAAVSKSRMGNLHISSRVKSSTHSRRRRISSGVFLLRCIPMPSSRPVFGLTGSVFTPCVRPRIMISVIIVMPRPLLTMRITVSSSTWQGRIFGLTFLGLSAAFTSMSNRP